MDTRDETKFGELLNGLISSKCCVAVVLFNTHRLIRLASPDRNAVWTALENQQGVEFWEWDSGLLKWFKTYSRV